MKISAKTKEKPDPITVEYDIPNTLTDLSKVFGEEVVAKAAQGAIVISLQAFMRRHIDKNTPLPDIQKEVTGWKPDVRSVTRQTAFEKATSSLDKLTPEERTALLGRLQAMNKSPQQPHQQAAR
jgi:hypothetical protein